ncbi:hypothetical protein SASPL_105723 [Salvia splendens]|uniref:Uncharacterized protein n=1 Tax=Salvia splendens TaxID=180675 RepID=A0A8X8YQ19_SALSN|nr:hypothetical protein SASPL_105723 [Salvia splendens]
MGSQQLSANDANNSPMTDGNPSIKFLHSCVISFCNMEHEDILLLPVETEPHLGRGIAMDRSRRVWTQREEEILMSTMKEPAAAGWKSDNGFRAGYLTRAKEALRREFPKTDLCIHPHIKSKISTWKRNYYSLTLVGVIMYFGRGKPSIFLLLKL